MSIIESAFRSGVIAVIIMFAVPAMTVSGAQAASASPLATSSNAPSGGTQSEGPYPPVQCFPMDMEGPGPILYKYTETVKEKFRDTHRDVHHYDYSFKYGERPSGSTWCFGRPELIAGSLSSDSQTCLYSGIAAVVGAVIPQVGVVNAVFFFSTTCGIALLVD